MPVGSYYGYARRACVGLRLFPNPDFNEAAKKKWDPVRYYNDPTYYNDKSLVGPSSSRHDVRFLSRRTEPGVDAPEDPEKPSVKT